MKTLDRKAAEIFRALLALQTTKIDNSDGTYMPVYLELIGRIDKYDFFFAGSLRTAERRCHARPRNAVCPAQRNTAIHPVLLSQ